MSDDLIERLEARISKRLMYYDEKAAALDREAVARIRELESEIQYRRDHTGDLIQDRDECKVSMVHYALDLKAAKRRIRELESRLATAEADALERAAKEIECGCNGWCMDPVNCSREDAEAIRSLKPKADE